MRLMLAASGVSIKLRMCRRISALFYKENGTDCACLAMLKLLHSLGTYCHILR